MSVSEIQEKTNPEIIIEGEFNEKKITEKNGQTVMGYTGKIIEGEVNEKQITETDAQITKKNTEKNIEGEFTEEDATIVYVVPVIDTQPPANPLTPKNRRTMRNLAIIQIILGVLCILCGIAALILCNRNTSECGGYCYETEDGEWTNVSSTVWGGILVIACASFSLFQDDTNANCLMTSKLAFKFVAGLTTGTMLGLEITADIYSVNCKPLLIVHSISASITIILLAVFIIDITYSMYLQCHCCKDDKENTNQVTQVTFPELEIIQNPHVTLPSGHTIVFEETSSTTSSGSPVSCRTERRGSNMSVVYLPTITS